MEIFKNKFLVKLIAALCIFLTLLNLGMPQKVYADDIAGSFLITPLTQLLTAISDGIITLLHKAVLEQDIAIIKISPQPDWWSNFAKPALILIATLGLIVLGAWMLPGSFIAGLTTMAVLEIGTSIAVKEILKVEDTRRSSSNRWNMAY